MTKTIIIKLLNRNIFSPLGFIMWRVLNKNIISYLTPLRQTVTFLLQMAFNTDLYYIIYKLPSNFIQLFAINNF